MLEFHCILESPTENTNSLVMQVVNLITPELNIRESDISISHRLPAAGGNTKPIIITCQICEHDNGDALYRKN